MRDQFTDDEFKFLKDLVIEGPSGKLWHDDRSNGKGDQAENTSKSRYVQYCGRCGGWVHYEVIECCQASNTSDQRPGFLYCELHVEELKRKQPRYFRDCFDELKRQGLVSEYKWQGPGRYSIRIAGFEPLDLNAGVTLDQIKRFVTDNMGKLFDTVEPALLKFEAQFNAQERKNMEKQEIGEMESLLKAFGQLILTGAPGTGKTHTALKIAKDIAKSEERIKKVQFHPGYDYSDFVMGLKPVLLDESGREIAEVDESSRKTAEVDESGVETAEGRSSKVSVSYRWKSGVFKQFADLARTDSSNEYVFVVDEINRADLSRVFGELFSLIEIDYRGANHHVTLPNGEKFSVPEKLYIIGTMNDIDRSVDSMDFALRRRFAWYEVTAKMSEKIIDAKMVCVESPRLDLAKRCKETMRALNAIIRGDEEKDLRVGLGPEYELGGAIFANAAKDEYKDDPGRCLWNNHIRIILSEYLRGNKRKSEILKRMAEVYSDKMGCQLDIEMTL